MKIDTEQFECIMQALAQLSQDNANLKQLLLDAVADISDLQARIAGLDQRFDEIT